MLNLCIMIPLVSLLYPRWWRCNGWGCNGWGCITFPVHHPRYIASFSSSFCMSGSHPTVPLLIPGLLLTSKFSKPPCPLSKNSIRLVCYVYLSQLAYQPRRVNSFYFCSFKECQYSVLTCVLLLSHDQSNVAQSLNFLNKNCQNSGQQLTVSLQTKVSLFNALN